MVIEYPSLRPVAFLLHQGSPSDAKIYKEILEELKRRRIARDGDTIIFDKGYYGYKNYAMVISRFKLIPVIFPRKNFKMEKLMAMLSYPLSIFNRSYLEKEKEFYRG
ncbi:IS5/IS1182 family transposase, partial [Methanophagales archaeon]